MILNPWQLSQCLYVKHNEQRSPGEEKWAGKKKRGSRRKQGMSADEDFAHLDAFVVTTVRFLRVQIYKTDLTETKRERQNVRVTL